jgi:hypothetical protein
MAAPPARKLQPCQGEEFPVDRKTYHEYPDWLLLALVRSHMDEALTKIGEAAKSMANVHRVIDFLQARLEAEAE